MEKSANKISVFEKKEILHSFPVALFENLQKIFKAISATSQKKCTFLGSRVGIQIRNVKMAPVLKSIFISQTLTPKVQQMN